MRAHGRKEDEERKGDFLGRFLKDASKGKFGKRTLKKSWR